MLKIGKNHVIVRGDEIPFWATTASTVEDKNLGNCVLFVQSFPDPMMGLFQSDNVYIKEADIPELIKFLQSVIDQDATYQ